MVNPNEIKGVPQKFELQDDTITENKVMINERFNKFYANIGPDLAKVTSNQTIPPQSFTGERLSSKIFYN